MIRCHCSPVFYESHFKSEIKLYPIISFSLDLWTGPMIHFTTYTLIPKEVGLILTVDKYLRDADLMFVKFLSTVLPI